ncbi:fermitin family homolog 3-like [Phaenicophaeus curvirostris]|uniref:fermitin family homolog 3-like n=1 Tax=Phaenicophaeus curvirostris TaxID=33595 RepID=UPI0037F0EAF7
MSGLRTASGEAIDGSFELQVEVEEGEAVGQPCPTAAPRPLALRVTGDLSVGGLMVLIAESLGSPRDWSDHALWWGQRGCWLLGASCSLDALGVGAAARLAFAPRHRPLLLRLPNRRRLRLRLCFARPVAHAVAQACALLGLGAPEELSLLRPLEEEEEEGGGQMGDPPLPDIDLSHLPPPRGETGGQFGGRGWRSRQAPRPPPPLPPEAVRALLAPRGGLRPTAAPRAPHGCPTARRTRLHARWLDSSRSLREQAVGPGAELLLRFKFPLGLELDPQRDARRLALLYEQGRWELLSGEIDCTQEEALIFAALQYHIDEGGISEEPAGGEDGDDLDAALSKLEMKLEGGPEPPEPLEEPEAELEEELEICRPPRLFRGFRRVRVQLKGGSLSYGRSPPTPGEPLQHLSLHSCTVTPEVDVEGQKFCIKLSVGESEGTSEVTLRCRDAPQYARWVSGCRAAAQGLPLRPTALGAEAQAVLGGLGGPGTLPHSGRPPPDPRVLLPHRFQRKMKAKQVAARVLSLLPPVAALPPGRARLRFLRAWSALPGFGLAYFLVRFRGARRDEVLAVGPSRLLRMELGGSVTRTWSLRALRQWDINWESQQVTLQLEGQVALGLRPLSASCRTLHEFLGGFICLGGGGDPRLLRRLLGDPAPR